MQEESLKQDTKAKILDAAEALFGEEGPQAVSLRRVTTKAGVNLAAVNYHFQSKEALMTSVIKRRLGPINKERLERLTQLEAEFGERPIPLEMLMAAMLEPMFNQPEAMAPLRRMLGRVFGDPSLTIKQLMSPAVQEVVERFRPAFRAAMPGASVAAVALGLHFAIGATAHWLGAGNVLEMICGEEHTPPQREEASRGLVVFACAGMRALVEKEVTS
jgi:AcrR family transcriptional regulator